MEEYQTAMRFVPSLTCVSKVAAADCNYHEWPNAGLHYGWENICVILLSSLRSSSYSPTLPLSPLTVDLVIKKMPGQWERGGVIRSSS